MFSILQVTFSYMLKFSLSRESLSADAMPLLIRDSVRASDNNFDKHYHLARFSITHCAKKKYIYLHCVHI
ncbi:hypothetical protein DKG79_04000 [Escherichia fergusonii]|nr:hypothetical protein DKG79_04000 [Escherichia fergusonii]